MNNELAEHIENLLEYIRTLNFAKPKDVMDSVNAVEVYLATHEIEDPFLI